MGIAMLGIDLGKNTIHTMGLDKEGYPTEAKKFTRIGLIRFLGNLGSLTLQQERVKTAVEGGPLRAPVLAVDFPNFSGKSKSKNPSGRSKKSAAFLFAVQRGPRRLVLQEEIGFLSGTRWAEWPARMVRGRSLGPVAG